MIVTEYIEKRITQRNLNHFRSLGYDCQKGDVIKIKPEQLTTGSHQIIDVSCEICENIVKISYKSLRKILDKHGYFSCKGKCSSKKVENTKLQKYGVTNNSKLESWKERVSDLWKNKTEKEISDIKERSKKTYFEKTGFSHPRLNPESIKKYKQTCLIKYGVENPSYLEEVKEKRVKTKLEKFGHINNSQTLEWKTKIENYWSEIDELEKEDIVERRKKTCLGKYGYEFATQSPKVKEITKKTNLEKYGVESPNQIGEVHRKQQLNGFKRFKFRDTDITYQGSYELDFLENFFDRLDIREADPIEYYFQGVRKYYYPDFFLASHNTIIEIKSKYYYELYLEKNLSKREATLDRGYNFILIIDKDYTELKKLIPVGN